MAPRKTKSQKRLNATRRVKFNKAVRPRSSSRSVRSVRSVRSKRSVRSVRSNRSVRPARSVKSIRSVRSVRSNRRVTAPSLVDMDSVPSQHSPEGYENIVLYYLSKLRKLFQPQGQARLGGSESCDTSVTSLKHGRTFSNDGPRSILDVDPSKFARKVAKGGTKMSREHARQKVLNIVTAAIDYGRANNVVAKKGNVFWIRRHRPSTSQKIAKREATPGPRGRRCSQCRKLTGGVARARSLTVSPSASLFDGCSPTRTSVTSVRSKTRSRSALRQPSRVRVAKRDTKRGGAQLNARVSTRRLTGVRGRKSRGNFRLARSVSRMSRLSAARSGSTRSNTRSTARMARSRSVIRTKGILKDKCNCSLCRLTKSKPN